jgi:hypothetical protein
MMCLQIQHLHAFQLAQQTLHAQKPTTGPRLHMLILLRRASEMLAPPADLLVLPI